MLDPAQLYTVNLDAWQRTVDARPPEGLVLLHLLDGFVDAGDVSLLTATRILERCEHEVVAEFDVDQLHDYRSRRPVMTFDTDRYVDVQSWRFDLHRVTDLSGRSFLMITGPEPDVQWERVAAAVRQLAEELGVSHATSAMGLPMAVPHTRPTQITAVASDGQLDRPNPSWVGRTDMPGSFAALLNVRLGEGGIRSTGFAAHVPHYLAGSPFHQAVLATGERIAGITELDLPLGDLPDLVEANLVAIASEVDSSSEVQQVVTGLERQYDALLAGTEEVPTAEEIGAELERYLADRDKRDGE